MKRIKLTKSLASQSKHRIAIANSLGLRKMNSSTVQPDNGATKGKIRKIKDLVTVENIEDTSASSK